MFRVLLIAHAPFATATLKTCSNILGENIPVYAVDMGMTETPEHQQTLFGQMFEELLLEGDVLVLVDFLGGSPCNVALAKMDEKGVEIITGFNLPLLFKAVTMSRDGIPVAEAARELITYGGERIQLAASLL